MILEGSAPSLGTRPPRAGGGPSAGSCCPPGPAALHTPAGHSTVFRNSVEGALSRAPAPQTCSRRAKRPRQRLSPRKGRIPPRGPRRCHLTLTPRPRAGRRSFRKEQDRARPTSNYITLTPKPRFMIGALSACSTPGHTVRSTIPNKPRTSTHACNHFPSLPHFRCTSPHVPEVGGSPPSLDLGRGGLPRKSFLDDAGSNLPAPMLLRFWILKKEINK